jgi:hypothetical protein
MDLSKLTLADKIIGATGILLIIDLLFLPWHDFDLGRFGGGSVTWTAMQGDGSFWGVLAFLLTIAVVATVAITRFTATKLPELPVPLNKAIFFGAIAVLVLLLLKLVTETDNLGYGAWLAILLGAGLTYGGFLKSSEADATDPGTNPISPV